MSRVLCIGVRPPRLRIFSLRIHHGLTGVLLIVAGLLSHRRGMFALGALLTLEDFKDWPFSLFDGS